MLKTSSLLPCKVRFGVLTLQLSSNTATYYRGAYSNNGMQQRNIETSINQPSQPQAQNVSGDVSHLNDRKEHVHYYDKFVKSALTQLLR